MKYIYTLSILILFVAVGFQQYQIYYLKNTARELAYKVEELEYSQRVDIIYKGATGKCNSWPCYDEKKLELKTAVEMIVDYLDLRYLEGSEKTTPAKLTK